MKFISTVALAGTVFVLTSAPASAQSVAAVLEFTLWWFFGGG